ncbi:MAG TPA: Fe-S cluster assembly protein SufD [Gammaproteobacteria bacterium]|nr:Fe-S cluster assembly protein SufD [Gammaproteobacteria bacterium]
MPVSKKWLDDLPKEAGLFQDVSNIDRWAASFPITLVFINGHFAKNASDLKNVPKSVTLCTITEALLIHEDRIKLYLLKEPELMTDGLFLDVPDEVTLDSPIHLLFIHTKQNEFVTHPKNILLAGKHSRFSLIEEHVSDQADHYFTNVVTEIHANQNAKVDYYKIQNNALTATHLAGIIINQQKDSRVRAFSFSKGARLSREDLAVFQREEAAETVLHGLYTPHQDDQHMDHHLQIDHLAAFGKSAMLYKGILDKKSRAVFNGKVHVHANTKQINAHQANHNLLLSKDAEINSKPELEIYAEDVKCTHGATIGQLDSESLFYLRSRGILQDEAHAMLVRAFSSEVYDRIEHEKIRQHIRERMNDYDV